MPLQTYGSASVGVGALEDGGDLQEDVLIGDGADEFETYGKARGGEAAGDGDGGDASEISGTIWAEHQCAG